MLENKDYLKLHYNMYIYVSLSRIREWEMLSDHVMEMFQFRVLVTKHIPDKIAISLHVSIGSRVNGDVRSRLSPGYNCYPPTYQPHLPIKYRPLNTSQMIYGTSNLNYVRQI